MRFLKKWVEMIRLEREKTAPQKVIRGPADVPPPPRFRNIGGPMPELNAQRVKRLIAGIKNAGYNIYQDAEPYVEEATLSDGSTRHHLVIPVHLVPFEAAESLEGRL